MGAAFRIINLVLLLLLLSCASTYNTQQEGKTRVESMKWSKVDGVVNYSGWDSYYTTTISGLKGYKPSGTGNMTRYGSDPDRKLGATGFFHVARNESRWWIVDPDGNAGWNVAVNGVRPGGSARNEKSLSEKFGSEEQWIDSTHKDLEEIGFNGTACWSEVPLIKYSNRHCSTPICYTQILSLWSGYHKQIRKNGTAETSFPVFDTGFETYVEKQTEKLTENNNDSSLFGYFSDNEINFSMNILDEYLAIKDHENPNYRVARRWLDERRIGQGNITDSQREMFLGEVAAHYYQVVATGIRKHDPNHLYLGSRLHSRAKHNKFIIAAAGKYCDVISINYYGYWEPLAAHFADWDKWSDKPVIITEFYIKGDDSGLPNISGAGWRVKTQEERGLFYENFCLHLLQMKNCVGWHWFRYMDNDPTDTTADESNNDSNKGIVNNYYEFYQPLARHMQELNRNRYNLIRYFDK